MAKKSLQQVVQENLQFGFDPQIIRIAYQNVNGDADRVIDQIFRLQEDSNHYPTKPSNPQDQDAQLSKAIEMSINEAKDKKISLEPLNPEQRIRKAGIPVGLKNIGNTCYFNSLLQTYFQNVEFVKSVLRYQTPSKYRQLSDIEQQKAISDDPTFKRKQASCKLVQNLKILFTHMILSDRKYVDPTDVISSIVDDDGAQLQIGDQKDIGEFNLVFLSRVDEGFRLLRGQQEMINEGEDKENEMKDSPSKIRMIGNDSEKEISLMRGSSIKIEHNSLVEKEFIGNMVNFYANEAHNIEKTEQEQFNLLFVNVNNRELYNAIEQITIQHIDDYRNDKGEVVGVEKQSWIKTPPKTLFFQIDRVTFDKEKCMLVKSNEEFEFPNIFYIDPFLLKNKNEALQVQKKVRKLREEKEKYFDALKKMEKFGEKNINLLDMFTETTKFLVQQREFSQDMAELDAPTFFPALKSIIKDQHINLLKAYSEQLDLRITSYQNKIAEIEKQIEKCYQSMRSTPYHLYSILVHEGSADSGHYYSYTYDIGSKIWRKYNDINISQEAEAQVMKQARGINYTSAYYLVYAQQEVLAGSEIQMPLRNYQISSSQKYMGDFYSKLVPQELIKKTKMQNEQMYYEIQQFKMGAFANRVVDSYTRNFEICNETFRKAKVQKKKTVPPLLTNLPVFIKYLGQDEKYKTALIENAINEYGPKQFNPVFQEILKKKLNNFNDFKKPKQIKFDSTIAENFISHVLKAQLAEKIFKALKNEEYQGILAMIGELLKGGTKSQYFEWLANLLSKVLIVSLLYEAEQCVETEKMNQVLRCLKYVTILCCKFIQREQEKILITNCCFWMSETIIGIKDPAMKEEAEKMTQRLNQGNYEETSQQFLKEAYSEVQINKIRDSIDIANTLWNLSRHENTLILEMLQARQQVKGKLQSANNLYKEMKKFNFPLKKEERAKILH